MQRDLARQGWRWLTLVSTARCPEQASWRHPPPALPRRVRRTCNETSPGKAGVGWGSASSPPPAFRSKGVGAAFRLAFVVAPAVRATRPRQARLALAGAWPRHHRLPSGASELAPPSARPFSARSPYAQRALAGVMSGGAGFWDPCGQRSEREQNARTPPSARPSSSRSPYVQRELAGARAWVGLGFGAPVGSARRESRTPGRRVPPALLHRVRRTCNRGSPRPGLWGPGFSGSCGQLVVLPHKDPGITRIGRSVSSSGRHQPATPSRATAYPLPHRIRWRNARVATAERGRVEPAGPYERLRFRPPNNCMQPTPPISVFICLLPCTWHSLRKRERAQRPRLMPVVRGARASAPTTEINAPQSMQCPNPETPICSADRLGTRTIVHLICGVASVHEAACLEATSFFRP